MLSWATLKPIRAEMHNIYISICPLLFPQQRRLGFQRTKNCPVSIGLLDIDLSHEAKPRICTIAASQLAT